MTTSEIQKTRTELKEWIDHLNDEGLLQLLQSLKLSSSDIKKDWWEALSAAEKEDIESGIEDYNAGNLYSSKKFWDKVSNE